MAWTTATTRSAGFTVTAAVWNTEHVDNMNFLKRVNETQYTAPVSVTGTGDVDIVTSGAITYEAVPHLIEFYSPYVQVGGSGNITFRLKDGATDLGVVGRAPTSSLTTMYFSVPITPTAASHTYKIAGANGASQTTTVQAGAGGTGAFYPGYIRIRRVPT